MNTWTGAAANRSRLSALYGLQDCGPCEEYVATQPHLVGAAASVGIEHGKSTRQVIQEYMAVYHQRGHKAAA